MTRVIIVDDEYLVRERIKKCIDWDDFGFQIAGEAANGEDALELLKQVNPQIAIVDINMPLVDGLEFSRTARIQYPELKVVILTGYSSFEYARGALQAGVSNYLLKPVNKDELKEVVMKLKEQIENESRIKNNIENLKINSRESSALQKEKVLQSVLERKGLALNEELRRKFQMYFPKIHESDLILIVVKTDEFPEFAEEGKDKELWRFAVSNIFGEAFEEKFDFDISYDVEGRMVLISNIIGDDTVSDYCSMCEKAQKLVQNYLRITVTVGIGNVHFGISGIALSYNEAMIAIRNRLIFGKGKIIVYKSLESNIGNVEINNNIRQKTLINLRLGNISLIKDEIRRTFTSITEKGLLIDNLYIIMSEFVLTLTTFAKENELNISEIMGRNFDVAKLIESKDSIQQVEEWFIDILNRLFNEYNKCKLLGYAKLVDKVRNYIDNNYSNKDISLETIAGVMSINPCHLSNIFKKEAGISIIEYLTERRMNTAKELIDRGNMKLVEIAEMVGFNDPYYFSKCFKKMFGVSPSRYFKTK